MNPRTPFLIGLTAIAASLAAAVLYFQTNRPQGSPPAPPRAAVEASATTSDPVKLVAGKGTGPSAPESATVQTDAAPSQPAPVLPQTTHRSYVTERIALLQDLSMDDQPSSLQTILGELSNRDPEIRKAAREAAVQFASRDAIPGLMDAASQTDDPTEKRELIEAAEFLKLPSLTEVMQQRGITPVITAKPAPGKKLPAFDRQVRPR